MPDAAHARHAKARASEEFKAGNLCAADLARIDKRADGLLGQWATLHVCVGSDPA